MSKLLGNHSEPLGDRGFSSHQHKQIQQSTVFRGIRAKWADPRVFWLRWVQAECRLDGIKTEKKLVLSGFDEQNINLNFSFASYLN